ncbi:glycosyl transferase family 2 [Clostridium sp. CAG:967]|mgnify:FL=1|nr:glycosyl transferase family 2 [Clostridium sp. CAG:967]
MILTYHKVSFIKNDKITVNVWNFIMQMYAIRKKIVVYLDDYDLNDNNQVVLRFDDGYKSVLKYAVPVLKFFGYPFEVFIVEDFFNRGEKGDKNFLNKKDLEKIIKSGGRLQYHTKSHPDLSIIEDEEILKTELICPEYIKQLDKNGFKFLAYPFWKYNSKSIEYVQKLYNGACSGNGFAENNKYSMDGIRVEANTKI